MHHTSSTIAERLSQIAAELDALAAQRSPGRDSYTSLNRARSAVGYAIADVRNEESVRLSPMAHAPLPAGERVG